MYLPPQTFPVSAAMPVRQFFNLFSLAFIVLATSPISSRAADFEREVRPVLVKYCGDCHRGADAEGEFDFEQMTSPSDIAEAFEIWESVVKHLKSETMPPEDEPQPTDSDREQIYRWYQQFISSAKPQPAPFRQRRLSVVEFRNTLHSVLGFELELAVAEAEQTITQRSLVVKLLPTDPPGESGFKNDTHANPLTIPVWDVYANLIDTAIEELFSARRRKELIALTGGLQGKDLSPEEATKLIQRFTAKAWRRPIQTEDLAKITNRLADKTGDKLTAAVKLELKAVLLSPSFTHRGFRMPLKPHQRQQVDSYELAERLSYFLWADMPDEALLARAASGKLKERAVLTTEIDRMLKSPRARSLAEVFGAEWFTLEEIERLSNNPPFMIALRSQPLDFLHYLFTENRPLLELVESDTAFANRFTAGHYGSDAKQLKRVNKPRGIEVAIVPNQKIELKATEVRGGILTMPGVLAMNQGPINRGVWVLERILGERLPEPPANVGKVAPNKRGETLTFRERFEHHRASPACAACHNKIDPIGFALEGFNAGGAYVKNGNQKIDTSGHLPTGENFANIKELKSILVTTQREAVLRNIVRRTMAYALCRKLTLYDYATVEEIVQQMNDTEATWRDLFIAIAMSPQFQETIAH